MRARVGASRAGAGDRADSGVGLGSLSCSARGTVQMASPTVSLGYRGATLGAQTATGRAFEPPYMLQVPFRQGRALRSDTLMRALDAPRPPPSEWRLSTPNLALGGVE